MNALAEYVQARLTASVPRAEIKEELLVVGWTEEDADKALREALIAMGLPVPSEREAAAPRRASTADIVLNFFSFILLCIVVTAIGALYFRIINLQIPDPLQAITAQARWRVARSIHYAIASLIIVFPLYALSVWVWFRRFRRDSARRESRLTKWLTYLVLLAASTVIVGDLVTILFTFLQGEFTLRFLLKAVALLVIAVLVLGFYALERREIQYRMPLRTAVLTAIAGVSVALILVGIVSGFLAAGSPESARRQAFDRERVGQLGLLAGCIDRFAGTFGELPASLDVFGQYPGFASCRLWTVDPESRKPYQYRVVSGASTHGASRVVTFELCATFSLRSSSANGAPRGAHRGSIWQPHAAGPVCHTFTAKLGQPATKSSAK